MQSLFQNRTISKERPAKTVADPVLRFHYEAVGLGMPTNQDEHRSIYLANFKPHENTDKVTLASMYRFAL